jgi:hypothetical protein
MHRPRILSLVSSWLASPTPSFSAATPLVGRGLRDVAGRAFAAGAPSTLPLGYLTVIARAYESDEAAASASHGLLADAGDPYGTPGISVVGRCEEALPAGFAPLDGGLVTWRTIAGPAAVRTGWATGVFRRGHLVWDITVSGADPAALADVVLDLGRELTHRRQTEWGLWDLVPEATDLPVPMTIDAVFTRPSFPGDVPDAIAA